LTQSTAHTDKSQEKSDYNLPPSKMTTCDLARLLRSDEIQKAIRPPQKDVKRNVLKRNPLKNHSVMTRLNPYATVQRKIAKAVELQHKKARQEKFDARRGVADTGRGARPQAKTAKPKGDKKPAATAGDKQKKEKKKEAAPKK